jgi:hypothetical protein
VLAKYGALCRLLLRLRRVAGMLDDAWAAMRAGGRPGLVSCLASRAGSRSDSPRCATPPLPWCPKPFESSTCTKLPSSSVQTLGLENSTPHSTAHSPSTACRAGGADAVLSPGLVRQMAAGAAARRPLWQLRAQMAHFIAHFISYLQVRRRRRCPCQAPGLLTGVVAVQLQLL